MGQTMKAAGGSVRERVSAAEWEVRVDLAACYRLFARYGWDDGIFTHNSARVPGNEDHFLLNPYGLMFHEITASNLVKVDMDGTIVDGGELGQDADVIKAGFTIHSAVHMSREDAKCVTHTHTIAGMAISAQKGGLLPLTQKSMRFYNRLAYHDYEGLAFYDEEKPRLLAGLGDANMLILRNHGTLTVGRTIAEAFFHMYNLERACRVQVLAQASGNTELLMVPEAVQAKLETEKPVSTWYAGYGEMELAAWMRKLDRLGSNFRE